MATVGLNEYNIDAIVYQTKELVRGRLGTPKEYPEFAPDGVGDEAYSMLLSPENEKVIRDHMADWQIQTKGYVYIGVPNSIGTNDWRQPTRIITANFKEPRLVLNGHGTVRNVPGITTAKWDGQVLTITKATDGSVVAQPNLSKFLTEMEEIKKGFSDHEAEVEKSGEDMRNFLRKHRTLQKAVKEFGPSLMSYVPNNLKRKYEAEPIKRTVRPKPAPVEVDTSYLVAHAVNHQLKLN